MNKLNLNEKGEKQESSKLDITSSSIISEEQTNVLQVASLTNDVIFLSMLTNIIDFSAQ